jgi:S-(hydroxymethyl)glutathione dehydrogenase/alcohol dehydrogenase
MKAAVLVTPGKPLEIWTDLEVPGPTQGQVLVQVAYSGVCHSQLMEARGLRGPDPWLPHLLGHEATGIVVAIGSGVKKVQPEDRVVLGWIKGEGQDVGGAKYKGARGVVNAGPVTTFNEYAMVSENRCVKIPPGIPMDVGVLFGCALPTGAGIVMHELNPEPGASLAVFGLGGIGMSALLAARVQGCNPLIAVDVSPAKLKLAAELGATHTIHGRESDPVSEIRTLTLGRGVDYAVEAAGTAHTIEQAFAAVRRGGGTCVFASHPAQGERISLDPYELIAGKRIAGSWGGQCRPDVDVPVIAELYLKGQLPIDKLIGKRYHLEQINDALDDLEAHRTARPLILINPALGTTAS